MSASFSFSSSALASTDLKRHRPIFISGSNKKAKIEEVQVVSSQILLPSSPTLTGIPESIQINIFQNLATEEELSKLMRVSKHFSNIICHKNNNDEDYYGNGNGNGKYKIKIFKKEFIPVITISPRIENCIGNRIGKRFGFGKKSKYCRGKITSYDRQSGLYKVKYEDDDSISRDGEEYMDEDDIEKYKLPRNQKIWHGHRFLASSTNASKVLIQLAKRSDTNTIDKNNLQHCRKMVVKDIDFFLEEAGPKIEHENHKIKGIDSLNLSLPSPTKGVSDALPITLSKILPSLREIDFSNTDISSLSVLSRFSTYCHYLEKITWCNFNYNSFVSLSGMSMRKSNMLKEIHMNNCDFLSSRHCIDTMSDLNNTDGIFIFYKCRHNLIRVSIQNANFCHRHWEDNDDHGSIITSKIPQFALIKFVLNAPQTLKWFRSDLSKENIEMLRQERPGIELLN